MGRNNRIGSKVGKIISLVYNILLLRLTFPRFFMSIKGKSNTRTRRKLHGTNVTEISVPYLLELPVLCTV